MKESKTKALKSSTLPYFGKTVKPFELKMSGRLKLFEVVSSNLFLEI